MENQEQEFQPRVLKVDSAGSWNNFLAQASPVVVHFTAAWCIPSVAMNPYFEEVAAQYPDVLFLTVDVDEVQEVASKLEIKAMPTFLLMKDGTTVDDKLVGANPEEIRKRIDAFVQSLRASLP